MSFISGLVPTTELECVNAMLSINGESPVDDLSTPSADVALALNLVRLVTKSVQSKGWHFNTDRLVTLTRDGGTQKIATPTDAMRVTKSLTDAQRDWDIAHRQGFLWDRTTNSNVFSDAKYASGVQVDIVRALDFTDMPETARQAVYIMAGRRFQEQTMGNAEIAQFTAEDEAAALKALSDAEGLLDDVAFPYNFKDQQMVWKIINDISKQVQEHGWHFNTRLSVGIAPDISNNITLPTNTIRAYKSNIFKMQKFDLAHRGSKMYDVKNDTFTFNAADLPDGLAYLDLVMFLDWDSLPLAAQEYIKIKVSRKLQAEKPNTYHDAQTPNGGYTEADEQKAWRWLMDAEGLIEDYNMIRNTTVGRVLLRRFNTLYQDTGGVFRK